MISNEHKKFRQNRKTWSVAHSPFDTVFTRNWILKINSEKVFEKYQKQYQWVKQKLRPQILFLFKIFLKFQYTTFLKELGNLKRKTKKGKYIIFRINCRDNPFHCFLIQFTTHKEVTVIVTCKSTIRFDNK